MLKRMRKMHLQADTEMVPIKKKAERRDLIREQKALIAANIEQKIEEELLIRLKEGVIQDVMNIDPAKFNKLLGLEAEEGEVEGEEEGKFLCDSDVEEEDEYVMESDLEEEMEMELNNF